MKQPLRDFIKEMNTRRPFIKARPQPPPQEEPQEKLYKPPKGHTECKNCAGIADNKYIFNGECNICYDFQRGDRVHIDTGLLRAMADDNVDYDNVEWYPDYDKLNDESVYFIHSKDSVGYTIEGPTGRHAFIPSRVLVNPRPSKFKVGDRVKVVDDKEAGWDDTPDLVGRTGTVKTIMPSDIYIDLDELFETYTGIYALPEGLEKIGD